eukprot:601164-Amphidinium_carterae.1
MRALRPPDPEREDQILSESALTGGHEVYNIDEIAIWMVGVGDRGWREKNEDAVGPGDSRQVTTVTLAMPLVHSERWMAQVLLGGK